MSQLDSRWGQLALFYLHRRMWPRRRIWCRRSLVVDIYCRTRHNEVFGPLAKAFLFFSGAPPFCSLPPRFGISCSCGAGTCRHTPRGFSTKNPTSNHLAQSYRPVKCFCEQRLLLRLMRTLNCDLFPLAIRMYEHFLQKIPFSCTSTIGTLPPSVTENIFRSCNGR